MITEQQRKYGHLSNLQLELLNAIHSLIFNNVVSEDECKDFIDFVSQRIEETRVRLVEEESKTPEQ
jgi:hypothetical protein